MDCYSVKYSVAIRTLGKAGALYQKTLDSIAGQSIKPAAVYVYLADGYPVPSETIGVEHYVRVPKGMVSQRALQYDEIDTEWILFLDDDVFLPPKAVETLFGELEANAGDVIIPATFYNHKASLKHKIVRTLTGHEVARLFDDRWSYKVLRTAGFSYNNNPHRAVYMTQTGAGPCFLCRKNDFLSSHYEEEIWLDDTPYAIPEDQVMFYKMYLGGLKLLTSFDSGIVHMDAGSTLQDSEDRMKKLIYSESRNKLIFWYKFLYSNRGIIDKLTSLVCIAYYYVIQYVKYLFKTILGQSAFRDAFKDGFHSGKQYIKNEIAGD